jgi:hypothetical protein
MRFNHALTVLALICGSPVVSLSLEPEPTPIQTVEVTAHGAFTVNGKPFFPIMAWLQDAKNFPSVKACGMNTTAGYWKGSGGTDSVTQYLKLIEDAGLYGVLPYDDRLKNSSAVLGYIHGDEPDLPHQVSDAEVVPGEGL